MDAPERGVPPSGWTTAYLAVHPGAEEAAHRPLSPVEGVSFARRAHTPAHVSRRGAWAARWGSRGGFRSTGKWERSHLTVRGR